MRLVTMNIWGTHGDWVARRNYLRDLLLALSPDVLTLQETIRTAAYDQAADLLGPDYKVINSRSRSPDGMGISTAVRLPVGEPVEIDLQIDERTADFPCTAMATPVRSALGEVLVINHFPSWKLDLEAAREIQAVRVINAVDDVRSSPEVPVIIAGDLDADPTAASLRFLTGRQSLHGRSVCYRDAWESRHPGEPGDTYTRMNPLMVEDWPFGRIDHVLVSCGTHGGPQLEIADCRRIFDTPRCKVWASDHFGVLVDLVANTAVPPERGEQPDR